MINTNRLVKTFTNLVEIDSPSGEEQAVAEFIFQYLSDLNIPYYQDSAGNVVATLEAPGESLILTAHMDTVEPGRNIKAVIKDDKIQSLGNTILGADNKASLATILESLREITENNIPHQSLEVVFTCSEETTNFGAASLDNSKLKSRFGYSFDLGGDLGTIFTQAPYYNRVDLTIHGRASHSSQPNLGINALRIVSDSLQEIKLGFVNETTICNFGKIQGGSSVNTVPETVTLNGEIRSFSKEDLDTTTSRVLAIFETHCQKLGAKLEHRVALENTGFVIKDSDPHLLRLIDVYNTLEIPTKTATTYGCFDANVYIENGIKIINSCDGTQNNHTNNEYITIKNLKRLGEIVLTIATK